jgi:hypothetical protein
MANMIDEMTMVAIERSDAEANVTNYDMALMDLVELIEDPHDVMWLMQDLLGGNQSQYDLPEGGHLFVTLKAGVA